MTQINLLPWREQKREQEKKLFISILMAWTGVALVVILLINYYVLRQVNNQQIRNKILQQEIAAYDQRIKEINRLKKAKEELILQITAVDRLQSTRMFIVYLFDELIRVVPAGVSLTRVERKEDKITLIGYANSNADVSLALENMSNRPSFSNPVLNEIKTLGEKPASVTSEFKLTFALKPVDRVGKAK